MAAPRRVWKRDLFEWSWLLLYRPSTVTMGGESSHPEPRYVLSEIIHPPNCLPDMEKAQTTSL